MRGKIRLWGCLLWISCVSASLGDGYPEAFAAYKSGALDEALQRVDKLLAEGSFSGPEMILKARILTAMKRYEEADRMLFSALDKDPSLHVAHFHIGESAFAQKLWADAAQAFQLYLSRDTKKKEDAILLLVYSYVASGNLPDAGKWAVALDPGNDFHPGYYFARATMARALNRPEDYKRCLEQARTIYGNDVFNAFEPDLLFVLQQIPSDKKGDE